MSPSPGSEEPYFGSVLFFKHLILATLLLMIVVPTCLAIFFGIYSFRLLNQIDELTSSPVISTLPTLEEDSQIDGEALSAPLSEDEFIDDDLPDYLYPVDTPPTSLSIPI